MTAPLVTRCPVTALNPLLPAPLDLHKFVPSTRVRALLECHQSALEVELPQRQQQQQQQRQRRQHCSQRLLTLGKLSVERGNTSVIWRSLTWMTAALYHRSNQVALPRNPNAPKGVQSQHRWFRDGGTNNNSNPNNCRPNCSSGGDTRVPMFARLPYLLASGCPSKSFSRLCLLLPPRRCHALS